MSNVRTTIRLLIALLVIGGAYAGLTLLLGQHFSAIAIAGVLAAAIVAESAWIFVRWYSPLHGWFGEADQEESLVRAMERELSRSLRYKAPLVVVGLHGKRGLRRANVATMLRYSDIIISGSNHHIVILMTETNRDNARGVVERMIEQLPVRGATIADETIISPATTLSGFGARHQRQVSSTYAPTIALLQGLRLGIFRSEARTHHGQPTVLYELSTEDIIAATSTTNARSMDDLTSQVA